MIGKVFDRIDSMRHAATKTELKLIEELYKLNKNDLIYMSITDLAEILGVAESTILRFCRKLDYKGFQDFKLNLSQDIATEPNNTEANLTKEIADNVTDAIFQTLNQLNYDTCLEIADKIIKAEKLCIFGVGNSYISTYYAKSKLIRAGLNAETSSQNHLQTLFAANLKENDLMILLSVSGSTKDILSMAEIAKHNNVPLVVITNYSKSPLAKYADYLLITSRKEAAFEGGSMATVVSQIYVIDVLCSAVFKLLGSDALERAHIASMAVSNKSL